MGGNSYKLKQTGFALVEALLVVVIIAVIAGVGAYVVRQKHVADSTLTTSVGSSQVKAVPGTTAHVDQSAQQEAKSESSVDSSADPSAQQTVASTDGAVNNVGGAYNETAY